MSLIRLLSFILNIFSLILVTKWILDMFVKNSFFKLKNILNKIVNPILNPIRKLIPHKAMGLDLSYFIVLLFIQILIKLLSIFL